jgi:hypothetical protein
MLLQNSHRSRSSSQDRLKPHADDCSAGAAESGCADADESTAASLEASCPSTQKFKLQQDMGPGRRASIENALQLMYAA